MMGNAVIPARRVPEMGFLNRVVPADQVVEAARAQCRSMPEQEAVVATEEVYDRLLLSQDSKEGPLAFAEKRPPRWQAI